MVIHQQKKQDPMSNNNVHFNNPIIKSLKSLGFILPKSEDEIEAFEKAMEKHDIPPLPNELNTSDKILQKGYSNPNKILPIANQESPSNLARAARQGNNIPKSVLDKMKKDREDAENK